MRIEIREEIIRKEIKADRIKAFYDIRDTPFEFDIRDRNHDWSGYSKARRLTAYLDYIGIAARTICYRFKWADTLVPPDIASYACGPNSHNFFTEALIPETRRWERIDPTWDGALELSGFPVAEWNGIESTRLAAPPTEIFSAERSAERCKMLEAQLSKERPQGRTAGDFCGRLNYWVASHRVKEPHA